MKGKLGAFLCSHIILLVTVCIAGFVLAADQDEPTYQGRNLSAWTHDLDPHTIVIVGHEPVAWKAIGHMGTNAIPTLLKWMSEPDPPEPFKTNVPPCFNTARSWRAGVALSLLGETARPAIPELTRLARMWSETNRASWDDPHRVLGCADSLAEIGPEAIPSLLSLATNAPPLTRWCAFHALQRFDKGPVAVALVPVLIRCLGDEREDVANEAASLLGEFDLPDLVVPALTNALQSSSALTRSCAVWCLAGHGENAVSAIPFLRAAMRDPDYKVRVCATNALRSMGGWQLVGEQWSRDVWVFHHGTNTCHGITPDFFTDAPSSNPQGGANGRQPSGSETNRASEAAASRRSP